MAESLGRGQHTADELSAPLGAHDKGHYDQWDVDTGWGRIHSVFLQSASLGAEIASCFADGGVQDRAHSTQAALLRVTKTGQSKSKKGETIKGHRGLKIRHETHVQSMGRAASRSVAHGSAGMAARWAGARVQPCHHSGQGQVIAQHD